MPISTNQFRVVRERIFRAGHNPRKVPAEDRVGMLSVGSLFSGIGGFDLGLERAGMRVVWQCESDDFCRRVLAKHWPDVPCYPDVSELRGADVERPVVLAGGFPCQGLSDAGLKLGLLDPRSGLWSEYARLVGEIRPRYVIVENVAALLGRGLGRVLGDLAAIGYDAEWDCIPASAVGAPHRRDRLWLVAYPNADQAGRGIVAQYDGGTDGLGGRASGGHADGFRDEVADTARERRERAGRAWNRRSGLANGGDASPSASARPSGRWPPEPAVDRVVDGFPGRVEQVRALGNALVPQIAEWIGRRILSYEVRENEEVP